MLVANAVVYYAEPRYTKDIDVWVEPTRENAERVWEALVSFGAPLDEVKLDDFCNPELIYQLGIAPNRIDIMMGIKGLEFRPSWDKRVQSSYGGETIYIIHIDDLIEAKKAIDRETDRFDVRILEKAKDLIE